MNKYLVVSFFVLLIPNLVTADDLKEPSPWSGSVNLGYNGSGGNTFDNNLAGRFNLIYQKKKWTVSLKTESTFSSNADTTTADRHTAAFETNYSLTEKNFAFFRQNTTYDKFNAFTFTNISSIGYGRQLLKRKNLTIFAQIGPGYRIARIAGTNNFDNNFITDISSTLSWALTSSAAFKQSLEIDIGGVNTTTTGRSTITTDLPNNLGFQVSFEFTNNSYIPADSTRTQNTDYQTVFSLVYSF